MTRVERYVLDALQDSPDNRHGLYAKALAGHLGLTRGEVLTALAGLSAQGLVRHAAGTYGTLWLPVLDEATEVKP